MAVLGVPQIDAAKAITDQQLADYFKQQLANSQDNNIADFYQTGKYAPNEADGSGVDPTYAATGNGSLSGSAMDWHNELASRANAQQLAEYQGMSPEQRYNEMLGRQVQHQQTIANQTHDDAITNGIVSLVGGALMGSAFGPAFSNLTSTIAPAGSAVNSALSGMANGALSAAAHGSPIGASALIGGVSGGAGNIIHGGLTDLANSGMTQQDQMLAQQESGFTPGDLANWNGATTTGWQPYVVDAATTLANKALTGAVAPSLVGTPASVQPQALPPTQSTDTSQQLQGLSPLAMSGLYLNGIGMNPTQNQQVLSPLKQVSQGA